MTKVHSKLIHYFGGKGWIVKHVLPILETNPAIAYVEPCFGSGAVFFAKAPHPVEIINDKDSLIYEFYKAIQDRTTLRECIKRVILQIPHRRAYYDAVENLLAFRSGEKIPPDVLVASTILYLRLSVTKSPSEENLRGGQTSLGFGTRSRTKWNLQSIMKSLRETHRRLTGAQIECMDALDLIRKYDDDEVIFYIDPPYHPETHKKGSVHYEHSDFDHEGLVKVLLGIKGKAILSCYYHETYKPLLENGWTRKDFNIIFSQFKDRNNKAGRRVETILLSPGVVGVQPTLWS